MIFIKKNRARFLATMCVLVRTCSLQAMFSGTLDPSFGPDGTGIVTTNISGGSDGANALVLQPDGKLVTAGYSGNPSDFTLVRYTTDGNPDPTFGINGVVTTPLLPNWSDAHALVLQPDGKLVAAGFSGNPSDFTLVRYTADGDPDPDFGTGGVVTTNISAGNLDGAYALVLQPDGKLVAAGFSDEAWALVRYDSHGIPDATFGINGIVTTPFTSNFNDANALIVQPDGKLVAAGRSGSPAIFTLVRYDSHGNPDPNFGINGVVTTPFLPDGSVAYALVLQPDGKLVVAGYSGNPATFTLVRYDSHGDPDATFGTNGVVTTPFLPVGGAAYALVLQPDGKLIAAGVSGSPADFTLVRYTPNGSLDTSFGTIGDGRVVTSIGSGSSIIYALVLQPDGKVVAAGQSSIGLTLARYLTAVPLNELYLLTTAIRDKYC